jgi:hypothetical protein
MKRMMKRILNYRVITVALWGISLSYLGQTTNQTLGIFTNSAESFNGYTLFAPVSNETTYLIDNCGAEINSWESTYRAGMMAYLLEDGGILRAGKIDTEIFVGGGLGGVIEKFSWSGELLWTFTLANANVHLHHDIEILPNGNVLAIAWKMNSAEDAISKGRDPNKTGVNVWSTFLIEIEPTYPLGGQIVWSWDAWDHLVQDFDPSLPSYGDPRDFPEKIDVNYEAEGGTSYSARDWLHTNSIDYNPVSNEIMISVHGFNELWIIDRESSEGIQYRWGNPMAYGRGTEADQTLFKQHNCHWIESGLPGAGDVLIYNNGTNRPEGYYSSIEQVQLPLLIDGEYPILEDTPFGPVGSEWTYPETLDIDFFSQNISGAQRLPNGNTLICEGASGHLFEINELGDVVWEYINPVSIWGILEQTSTAFGNSVFQAPRYAPNYAAFTGRDLTPGAEIEINPLPSMCEINYAPTCPGDFNYDYMITVEDLIVALSEFGCTNCTSDIDGDQSFGISDLLILLSAFGTSC